MTQLIAQLDPLPIPLLAWYHEVARALPWRPLPGSGLADPYGVWVSEIMLQQTRVVAVLDYYARFMAELPTVFDLATVSEERLLKLWQGLGYYNRARNLQKAAQVIVEQFDGQFPPTYDGLLALPGIGSYTAGAIGSIAFGLPVPAVDGNVLRVISRICGDFDDILKPQTKKKMESALTTILPQHCPGDFNQALMELGATVCLPNGAPKCDSCPARPFCKAHLEDLTDKLPVKTPKKPRKIEHRLVELRFYHNKVALRQRPPTGLLAKLWEFPHQLMDENDPLPSNVVATATHIFTHIEWHMTAISVEAEDDQLPPDYVWATKEELQHIYPVPNAFGHFIDLVNDRLER